MFSFCDKDFVLLLKKFFLFILPILVIFAVFDLLAIYAGELVSVKKVISAQNSERNNNILYGRKIVDQELRRYKYFQFLHRQSDILALGSSRILPLREEFFSPYYSFTNTGSLAHNLGDVDDFVGRLATTTSSRKIFISLDYYWFGDKREIKSALTSDLRNLDSSLEWRAHILASRYLILTLLKNPKEFFSYFDKSNELNYSFGFQAKEGNGYRKDGSYSYGTYIKELKKDNKYRDREQPSIIDRIKTGSGSFAFDSQFDQDRILILDRILKTLKNKNYQVIGVSLPFSKEVYVELLSNPHHRDLFLAYQNTIPKIFKENGFKYYDYSDLEKLNLSDIYMFDGVHISETAMADILFRILGDFKDEEFEHRKNIMEQLSKILKSPETKSFELDTMLLSR